MSSRRDIKKHIEDLCGDLATEVMIWAQLNSDVPAQKVNKIIADLAQLQTDAIASTNFSFDRTERDFPTRAEYRRARTAYNRKAYDKIRRDLNKGVEEIAAALNAATPGQPKEADKPEA